MAEVISDGIANPASYGLTNVTDPAAPGLESGKVFYNTDLIASDSDAYLFWIEVTTNSASKKTIPPFGNGNSAMPRCAFLTIASQDGWFIDDELVHDPLRNLSWEITDVVWNAEVDWNTYDVVVIRSPWNYQQNLPEFLSVLRRIEASSAALHNSLDIVTWNVDKHYLFDWV